MIEQEKIKIVYLSKQSFGENGSKRRDGKVRISKWYSDETTKFVTKYNIDKLDDIGDTILMIKSFLKKEL